MTLLMAFGYRFQLFRFQLIGKVLARYARSGVIHPGFQLFRFQLIGKGSWSASAEAARIALVSNYSDFN